MWSLESRGAYSTGETIRGTARCAVVEGGVWNPARFHQQWQNAHARPWSMRRIRRDRVNPQARPHANAATAAARAALANRGHASARSTTIGGAPLQTRDVTCYKDSCCASASGGGLTVTACCWNDGACFLEICGAGNSGDDCDVLWCDPSGGEPLCI